MSSDDQPGSHAANQSKTEPMPPTQHHGDPQTAPGPVSVQPTGRPTMSVASDDPQSPTPLTEPGRGEPSGAGATSLVPPAEHADSAGGAGDAADVPVTAEDAAEGTSQIVPPAQGSRPG